MRKPWFLFLIFSWTLFQSVNQFRHTTIANYRQLTELESIRQLDRMNLYPQYAYRLAHIVEARPESVVLSKLQSNFINIFNINTIFQTYYWPVFLPFFLFGLFKIIESKNISLLLIFSLPILLLTLIGPNSSIGPVSLFPSIDTCIFYGFYCLISHAYKNK